MNKPIKTTLMVSSLLLGQATADTLELADGSLLEGDFVGSSNGIVMFDTGTGIEAYPEAEVVGIYLSSGVQTAQKAALASELTLHLLSGNLIAKTQNRMSILYQPSLEMPKAQFRGPELPSHRGLPGGRYPTAQPRSSSSSFPWVGQPVSGSHPAMR